MLTILHDGWSLVQAPNSPAALHLLALLAYLPPEVKALVALPGQPPEWFPPEAIPYIHPTEDSPRGRLNWEQRVLPQLVEQASAEILHLVSSSPPLFGPGRSVVSPTGFGEVRGESGNRSFFERLREAVSKGGMTRIQGLLWPEDLPLPVERGPALWPLPPVVYPGFTITAPAKIDETGDLDLPEGYVLYHGPQNSLALRRLLDTWSWAAGPIGTQTPLLLLGIKEDVRGRLPLLLNEYGVSDSVQTLPCLSPRQLAAVYRGCSVLLHTARPSPWGDPLRAALACGKPIVAAEDPLAGALVGPAAYLAPPGDARAMGAALLTAIVEEEVAERLAEAAQKRGAGWRSGQFASLLLEVYQKIQSTSL